MSIPPYSWGEIGKKRDGSKGLSVRIKADKIRTNLFEMYPDIHLCFMDGYDDCIVGVVERIGSEPHVCYDEALVIESNVKKGMTRDEAEEWLGRNQKANWVGEATPCFIRLSNN